MIPNSKDAGPYRAIIDTKNKKVFCVLLQAIYGGDSRVCSLFDTDLWILSPPSDPKAQEHIKGVQGTGEEWWKLANSWNAHHKKEKENVRTT